MITRRRLTHLNNQAGATYLLVMFAVVVMSIAATAAAKQWKTMVQREKEADLLARGIEIQTAIGNYSMSMKKGRVVPGEFYPLTLEELTKSPKPFLRKKYKDPITGRDWDYIRDPVTGRIKGVRSPSKLAPMKQHQFPSIVAHFEGVEHYNEWLFQYPSMTTLQTPQALPGQPGLGTPSPQAIGSPTSTPATAAPSPPPAMPGIHPLSSQP